MLLDRELRYVAANRAYLKVTGRRLEELLGRRVTEVFPHDPDNPDNENARRLIESLERVVKSGQADVLAVIAYRTPEDNVWSATHTPIFDAQGRVSHVLQHTVRVTDQQ